MLGQTIVTDIITKAVHIHASQFHNDPDTWCEWIQGFLVCLKKKYSAVWMTLLPTFAHW